MKIGEVMGKVANLPYLTISGQCSLEKTSEKVTRTPQIRGIYVINEQGQLQGYLSLGVLIRNIMAAKHKHYFHVRSLLARITSNKLADIMEKHLIYATKEDDIEKVLDQMVSRNIKEIPVVDEKQRIITVIGILDLWKLLEK
ncbi:MAG TPA: CBS domain-containing protein [Desulfobacteraceae bacterium]|nr:CBS domain-containing protein [Desulfobacteraceae bacterium]